jgi:hypothetical protein
MGVAPISRVVLFADSESISNLTENCVNTNEKADAESLEFRASN